MGSGRFGVLFVIFFVLMNINVLAVSDELIGLKINVKEPTPSLLQEQYKDIQRIRLNELYFVPDSLSGEFGFNVIQLTEFSIPLTSSQRQDSLELNQRIATTSGNIQVVYPIEGFYYITDFLEVTLETDATANCQYNFQDSGFKTMESANDTLHYHYLYHLEDNMASAEPYVIDFKCIDLASSESTASTYLWINTTDLDRYFLRDNIGGWSYLLSGIEWSGNDSGLLESYGSLYNQSNGLYTIMGFFVFDNPSSIQEFIANEIAEVFDNVSIGLINGSKVYTFQDELGGKYAAWTHQNQLVIVDVFVFENSTPVSVQLPLEVINAYLAKYPSNVNATVLCNVNNQCNDSNPYTFDQCINPGQLNATCTHQSIQCLKNSDCGNSSNIKYCSINNSLCSKTNSYACINPGTLQSSCTSTIGESCSSCSFGCNNQSLICRASPVITLYSPLSKIYNLASIPFNLTAGNDSFSEISFIDWNEARLRWTILCRNCNEYGFRKKGIKSFGEGAHNLTFRAIKGTNTISKNVSFFVDSKNPKISKTLPKSKSFTNGSNFYVKYSEDNCKSLTLNIYSNASNRSAVMNCSSGMNVEKIINFNLSLFNNKEVEYQFIIRDIANNSAESRRTRIKVDTIKPVINSLANITNGRRVTFILNITELNFDEVNYVDYDEARPAERTLCSSLRNGMCSSTKTFGAGHHNITITVLDDAGNSVQKNIKIMP